MVFQRLRNLRESESLVDVFAARLVAVVAVGDSDAVEVDVDFVVNLVVADGGVVIIGVHMHEAGEKNLNFLSFQSFCIFHINLSNR